MMLARGRLGQRVYLGGRCRKPEEKLYEGPWLGQRRWEWVSGEASVRHQGHSSGWLEAGPVSDVRLGHPLRSRVQAGRQSLGKGFNDGHTDFGVPKPIQ